MPCDLDTDERWMNAALEEAALAEAGGDVPVGAVVVRGGELVARAHNRRQAEADPTAHAEILALREAGRILDTWYLEDCELYVTLEPCVMCAGALVWSRLHRVIFGATDPKAGGTVSLYTIPTDERLNHRLQVTPGVLEPQCREQLQLFFRKRRENNKPLP